jgi:CheY-like chemotaxis protein
MSAHGQILVADDDAAIRTVLNQALSRVGHEVRVTSNAATLWRWVAAGEGDLVITDVVMPDENAFDMLPRIRKARPELPVVVMSAQNTFMTAIRASEAGAYEYLPKPFDLTELLGIVQRALAEPRRPKADHRPEDQPDAMPLVGRSAAMQDIYRMLARMMQTDLTVMITGESGTGKELVARALHEYGRRRNGPFVAINMAAIPRDLIESELFGHEKGAFTGAQNRSTGRFEQAARCSSTRSAICRWKRRRGFCAFSSRANTRPWAAVRRSVPMCASSPPPTRICAPSSTRVCFARICSTGSMSCRCACRRCGKGPRIFPILCATSSSRARRRACRPSASCRAASSS